MPSSAGAQITDLLASTVEISNLMSVLSVLAALLVMLVFLTRLIYQVGLGLCQMLSIDRFQNFLDGFIRPSESPGNLI